MFLFLSLFFSTDSHNMLRIGFNCIQHFAMRGNLFCKGGRIMFYCSGTLSLWIWFRNQVICWKHASTETKPKNPHFCLFYSVIVRLLAKLTPHSSNGRTSIKMKIDKQDCHYRPELVVVLLTLWKTFTLLTLSVLWKDKTRSGISMLKIKTHENQKLAC